MTYFTVAFPNNVSSNVQKYAGIYVPDGRGR